MEIAYAFICESIKASTQSSDSIDALGIFETKRFDVPSTQNRLTGQAVVALRLLPSDAGIPFTYMIRAVDPDGVGIGSKAHSLGPSLPRSDGTVPDAVFFSEVNVPLVKAGDYEIEIHHDGHILKTIPVRVEFEREASSL